MTPTELDTDRRGEPAVDESQRRERRERIRCRLRAVTRRLESVELLVGSAPRDAAALCAPLLEDLCSTFAAIAGLSDDAPLDGIAARFEVRGVGPRLLGARRSVEDLGDDPDASAVGKTTRQLAALVEDASRAFDLAASTTLSIPADARRRRMRWLATAAVVLIAGLIALPFVQRWRIESRVEKLTARAASAVAGERHDEAVRLYREIIDLAPDRASALVHNNLGWSLQQLGRLSEAVVAYEQAVRKTPASTRAKSNLEAARALLYDQLLQEGRVAAQAGEHTRAVERYRRAVSLSATGRNLGIAYNNLGWSLQQLGRYEEAIEAYAAAVRINPDYALYRNNLAAVRRLRRSAEGDP